MHRSLLFLIFLTSFFLINVYLCYFKSSSSSLINSIQLIRPLNQTLLIHINGNMKYLGQASPIYILNLPTRIDRRIQSIALIQTFDLDAFIFPAYSIHSPEIYLYKSNLNKLFLKSTEVACWASHMHIWITIVNNIVDYDNNWSLVFEDDIDLEIDTPLIMRTFPQSIWNDADLIYLGHCANPAGQLIYQSSEHIYRIHQARNPSCTHAYAIKTSVAKKLIDLLPKPSQPIDDSIIKLVKNHQLTVYSIHPPLAIQKQVTNQNPSDVNKINRNSLIYHIQLYIYNFLQWWNGVEFYDKLNKSALNQANLTRAEQWRMMCEKDIWQH